MGTPSEIYDMPATPFVNFVDNELSAHSGQPRAGRCGGTTLQCDTDGHEPETHCRSLSGLGCQVVAAADGGGGQFQRQCNTWSRSAHSCVYLGVPAVRRFVSTSARTPPANWNSSTARTSRSRCRKRVRLYALDGVMSVVAAPGPLPARLCSVATTGWCAVCWCCTQASSWWPWSCRSISWSVGVSRIAPEISSASTTTCSVFKRRRCRIRFPTAFSSPRSVRRRYCGRLRLRLYAYPYLHAFRRLLQDRGDGTAAQPLAIESHRTHLLVWQSGCSRTC